MCGNTSPLVCPSLVHSLCSFLLPSSLLDLPVPVPLIICETPPTFVVFVAVNSRDNGQVLVSDVLLLKLVGLINMPCSVKSQCRANGQCASCFRLQKPVSIFFMCHILPNAPLAAHLVLRVCDTCQFDIREIMIFVWNGSQFCSSLVGAAE